MTAETRLRELGLTLPPAPKPVGLYKPVVIVSGMAYLSGHGPLKADKTLITGRLGADMDVKAGYEAARVTGLAMLATLQSALGSLDRVTRLVKLLGLVRCTEAFTEQPAVINGCSELFRISLVKTQALRLAVRWEPMHYPVALQLRLKRFSR